MLTLSRLKQLKRTREEPDWSKTAKFSKACIPGVRIAEWHGALAYQLIGNGHVFENEEAIVEAFADKKLECSQFWEFCHIDPKVPRHDKMEPKYIALFKLSNGKYLIPQAKHYKQAYANGARLDSRRAAEILPNGRPYWCCIHGIRIRNEQASKRNYQLRKSKNIISP
jgi:hypothetical protein